MMAAQTSPGKQLVQSSELMVVMQVCYRGAGPDTRVRLAPGGRGRAGREEDED